LETIEIIAKVPEVIGVAVITFGFIHATVRGLLHFAQKKG
jgi:hypothetical protein